MIFLVFKYNLYRFASPDELKELKNETQNYPTLFHFRFND